MKLIKHGGEFILECDKDSNEDLLLKEDNDDENDNDNDKVKFKKVRDGRPKRFIIERKGIFMNDTVNRFTSIPVKAKLESIMTLKRKASNDQQYCIFEEENIDYDYNTKIDWIAKPYLEDYWDDINEIFWYCKNKMKYRIEIDDIEGVKSHFQCEKQIYYVVTVKNRKSYLWLRMEDCFSYHIFMKIRTYLLTLYSNSNSNLADSTIYHELQIYLMRLREWIIRFNNRVWTK